MSVSHWTKRLLALATAIMMTVGLAACGTTDSRTVLTVWSWEPSMGTLIKNFEHENPDIVINQVFLDGYDGLNSAIQNGYGTPDVVQLSYSSLPQYAVSSQLVDLTDRTEGYGDFYTPGTWASVQLDSKVYAVPMDSGPMAFFYNKDVFEQAGVDPTTINTWDDYYQAAKKLKQIGVYITADSGSEASFYESMIWLAGGRPFTTAHDGREVTINLTKDEGTLQFTEFWQKMITEGLVNTSLSTWSDDWKAAVGDGQIASLFAGAWMPSLLLSDVPASAGLWRVKQMPTEDGVATNAENGGSALGILNTSRVPDAAFRFITYACHSQEGINTRVDGGAFPADIQTLNSSDFLNKTTVTDSRGIEVPYFGGQKYNEVLSEAAKRVSTGYQYLPFEVYANTDFKSTVGKAYAWATAENAYRDALKLVVNGVASRSSLPAEPGEEVTLKAGIGEWQTDLKEYGTNQGFTIQ